MRAVI
jgi:hypothetical protein